MARHYHRYPAMSLFAAAAAPLSTAAGFGSLLSGIGSVAGAFGLGSKSKSPSGKDYYKSQYFNMAAKHNFAKQFGYHPMYLMGAPAISPGPTTTQQGPDLRALGEGIKDLAGAPAQQAMQALGLRQAEAETRLSELQAEAAQIEVTNAKRSANAQQDKVVAATNTWVDGPFGNRKVTYPGLADESEKHYGDLVSWIEGGIMAFQDRYGPWVYERVAPHMDELRKAIDRHGPTAARRFLSDLVGPNVADVLLGKKLYGGNY